MIFFTKTIDIKKVLVYNIYRRVSKMDNLIITYGGIAQLARALGSYPGCHWFKSSYRYHRLLNYQQPVMARWSSG